MELNYVGVIIGPDLVILDGEVVADAYQRSSNDRSIFGLKKMMKESPEEAKELAEMIIKKRWLKLYVIFI